MMYAQPLRVNGPGDVHRMHHVGEQHRHLFVFRMCGRLGGRLIRTRDRTAHSRKARCRTPSTPLRPPSDLRQ